jgi:hypothetical protein
MLDVVACGVFEAPNTSGYPLHAIYTLKDDARGIIHYLSAGIAATYLDSLLKNPQGCIGETGDIAERSSRYLRIVFKFLAAYTMSHLRSLFCLK